MTTDYSFMPKSRLAAFTCWLKDEEWTEEPVKCDYEALRMTKAGSGVLLIYTRLDAPQHLSIWGESLREFNRWRKSK